VLRVLVTCFKISQLLQMAGHGSGWLANLTRVCLMSHQNGRLSESQLRACCYTCGRPRRHGAMNRFQLQAALHRPGIQTVIAA
jgi:hypothetical protein